MSHVNTLSRYMNFLSNLDFQIEFIIMRLLFRCNGDVMVSHLLTTYKREVLVGAESSCGNWEMTEKDVSVSSFSQSMAYLSKRIRGYAGFQKLKSENVTLQSTVQKSICLMGKHTR
jgi:hypothetical protein